MKKPTIIVLCTFPQDKSSKIVEQELCICKTTVTSIAIKTYEKQLPQLQSQGFRNRVLIVDTEKNENELVNFYGPTKNNSRTCSGHSTAIIKKYKWETMRHPTTGKLLDSAKTFSAREQILENALSEEFIRKSNRSHKKT